MKKDKKAILGMNTAQQFIVGILTLVILAVMVLVIFAALRTTIPTDSQTISFTNETTIIVMNHTTPYQISGTSLLDDCVATITRVTHTTNSTPISDGNYTVSACVVDGTNADGAGANNSAWNLTGSYTHTVGTARTAIRIIDNTTNGLGALFGNVVTWFVLLGLVIIILIIGVVIGVVRGFGAGTGAAQGL